MSTIQISALPAASAITADDLLPIEHDPSGTPVTQKATAAVFAAGVRGIAGAYVTTNIVPSGATSLTVNAAQADVDVRIKGDTDAALVFLDAGTNRVGIGTATPTTLLDVSGTLKATAFTGSGASLTGLSGIASSFQSLASDPASPTNGDVWYNSTSNTFKGRRAGLTQTFTTSNYLIATGGTITTSGNYKIHTFLSSGTFTVTHLGSAPTVEYLVVAGGGGTTTDTVASGGGGGGGYRTASGFSVTATAYTITVGAGGATATQATIVNGSNSTFSTITSAGGGKPSAAGGSGGGKTVGGAAAGAGNTPSTSPSQGNAGGTSGQYYASGGGGGAGGTGSSGNYSSPVYIVGGNGGAGSLSSIDGYYYSGGGGGGVDDGDMLSDAVGGNGGHGAGGGGAGGGALSSTRGGTTAGARNTADYSGSGPFNGATNTGGGGGARAAYNPGAVSAGAGGSGIVIIKYQFQ